MKKLFIATLFLSNIWIHSEALAFPPRIHIHYPGASGWLAETSFNIQYFVYDPEQSPFKVYVFYDTDTDYDNGVVPLYTNLAFNRNYRWERGNLPDGAYYVGARVEDTEGNFDIDYSDGPVIFVPPGSLQKRTLVTSIYPITDWIQVAIWITDLAGRYYDTVFLTALVGKHGLGNRPGALDLVSKEVIGTYGRRNSSLPVWAHNHGIPFPRVEFQDGRDSIVSNIDRDQYLSPEPYYPLLKSDKGTYNYHVIEHHPPRTDLPAIYAEDWAGVVNYNLDNIFDALTGATPLFWTRNTYVYEAKHIPPGKYYIWCEVNEGCDKNSYHDYPGINDSVGWRGQPATIWRVELDIENETYTFGTSCEYMGYASPDGSDGEIRPPDSTITTAGELLYCDNGAAFKAECYPDGVGIQEPKMTKNLSMRIWPNPFKGMANLSYYVSDYTKAITFRIHDLTGGLVASETKTNCTSGWHNMQWNLTSLPAGTYLFVMQADNVKLTQKLGILR